MLKTLFPVIVALETAFTVMAMLLAAFEQANRVDCPKYPYLSRCIAAGYSQR